MHAKSTIVAFALILAGTQVQAQNAGQVRLSKCLVSLKEGREIEVPALVAGPLVSLEVHEGHEVEAGTVIGAIDDKQAQANREERMYDVEVSREQAENDVNIRFAQASLRVSEKTLQQSSEANKKVPGSVTQTELLRQALDVEKTRLQIEVAQIEQKVAKHTMGAKLARLKEIEGIIERSQIKAPVSGEVVEMVKQRGEWCEPGAIVLKMARLDELRVEGFVNASQLAPSDVADRPVTVQVRLAGNVVEQFQGSIIFVDPRVQAGGEYRVYAKVKNRRNRANTHWLLRPGTDAEMVIDIRAGLAQQPPQNQGVLPAAPMRR